jgi:hypothetical protein
MPAFSDSAIWLGSFVRKYLNLPEAEDRIVVFNEAENFLGAFFRNVNFD